MNTSILIVDSQQLVREGLRAILASNSDLEVIGDVADGRSAVTLASQEQPDVVIIEGQLPRLSGIEAIRQIREESPQTACIVLWSLQGSTQVRQALLAGAAGFVSKDSSAEDLVEAVHTVCQGRSYLAPTVADQVVNALRAPNDGKNGELTRRQREVLQLIAEGLSTKEIALELGISIKTAQTHRAKLMLRVGVRKASALVRYAIREGIVSA
ncbi:MAG: response regulator transcription factor [Myxococcota bacterium]